MTKLTRPPASGLKAFYDYAKARHLCYINKFVDPKWKTPDPVLAEYSFCNVFRELDKTTKWFAENVRDPMSKKRDPRLLLATVVFRMFNRIETGEAMFKDDNLLGDHSAFHDFARTGKTSFLKKAILARLGKRGPFVTGSYIIAGPAGMPKLDGVLEVLDRFYRAEHHLAQFGEHSWRSAVDRMPVKKFSLQQAHEWLSQFDYLGNFHSYEIVTDLRHTFLLSRAPDIYTWANPGPGCKRGLNRLYGRDKSDTYESRERMLQEMDFVLEAAGEYWTDFAHKMRDAAPKLRTPLEWEMRDVEHTLCEFDKYRRTIEGDGRPRGKYRGHVQ